MERLAIVTFLKGGNEHDMTGVVTAPLYMARMFRKYIPTVDVISVRDHDMPQPRFWDANNVLSGDTDLLNTYDHVIFVTAGEYYTIKQYERDISRGEKGRMYARSKYPTVLNGLSVPFTLMTADEQDYAIYVYIDDFLSHPYCKGVMFMGEVMRDRSELLVGRDHLKSFILPPMVSLNPRKEIIDKAADKPDSKSIISLSRWIPCKRIREYLSLVKEGEFSKYDIRAEIASSAVSTYYNYTDLQPSGLTDKSGNILPEVGVISHGLYDPTDLPDMLRDITFTWDFLFYKKSGKMTMTPRLQQTSIEALNEGCLPVVCSQYTPDWLGYDGIIRLDKNDVHLIPSILGKMGRIERVARIDNYYQTLDSHMKKYYEDYLSEIS